MSWEKKRSRWTHATVSPVKVSHRCSKVFDQVQDLLVGIGMPWEVSEVDHSVGQRLETNKIYDQQQVWMTQLLIKRSLKYFLLTLGSSGSSSSATNKQHSAQTEGFKTWISMFYKFRPLGLPRFSVCSSSSSSRVMQFSRSRGKSGSSCRPESS